jgi:hypothetical protein
VTTPPGTLIEQPAPRKSSVKSMVPSGAVPISAVRCEVDPEVQLLNVIAHRTSLDNHQAAPPGLR